MDELERKFGATMFDIYKRANHECQYNPTRFLQMLHEHGGLATARLLLHAATVSDGYRALWERRRLDLTVEAVMLAPEWRTLFTDQERRIASDRLKQYGFKDAANAE